MEIDQQLEDELEEYGVQILSYDPLRIGFIDDPDSIATGDMAELLIIQLLYDDEDEDEDESEETTDEPYDDGFIDEDRPY